MGHRNRALQELEQGAEGLSREEKMALISLLNSYVDVFALVDGEFGKTNKIKHRINTQGAEPVSSLEGDGHSTKEMRCGVCLVICLRGV